MAASSGPHGPPPACGGADLAAPGAAARLDEFDRVEWADICRKLVPGITQERIDRTWDAFQIVKARGFVRQ